MKNRMLILVGLPGSGKSKFAHEIIALDNNALNFARINWDDLRAEDPNYKFSHAAEKQIKQRSYDLARHFASLGYNLIIDNTNLTDASIGAWTRLAEELNLTAEVKTFSVPVEECIRRDAQRVGRAHVGRIVIERMALANGLIEWPADKKIVIVDIDGTLADCRHRRFPKIKPCTNCKGKGTIRDYNCIEQVWDFKYLCQLCSGQGQILSGTDWDKFYRHDLIAADPPFPVVVDWVMALYETHIVCVVSGRPDNKAGKPTLEWLEAQGVPYHHFFMRQGGDMRDDTIVKQEILAKLPKHKIAFSIDDRNRVVDMWRANKVTCYQVCSREDGDF